VSKKITNRDKILKYEVNKYRKVHGNERKSGIKGDDGIPIGKVLIQVFLGREGGGTGEVH